MSTIAGIDTSDAQTIENAKGPWQFLIRKAGEGLDGPGKHVGADRCDADIALAKKGGKDAAIYWFVHPDDDGIAQAELALAAAKRNGVHGVACDCEVTDGDPMTKVAAVMHAFLSTVTKSGLAVLLYDNLSWVGQLGAEKWGNPIWLADPSHAEPSLPCVCHQYGTVQVAGVGLTDVDHWVGTQTSYDLFFHGVKPAPKPVVQRLIAGMSWTPNTGGSNNGKWLVYEKRKAGIPTTADFDEVEAKKIPEHPLNAKQIEGLTTVAWGAL